MELTTKQGFKQTEVGLIPEDWNEIKLGKNAMMFSGGTPNTAVKEYYKGDIPWISSSELNQKNIYSTNRFISENGLNNSSAKLVFENTFLLAMYGATAGICAITKIKGAINQAVLAIESERITSSYLYHFFSLKKEEIILKYCQGGQPNLSGSIVKSIKIPLPSTLKEQKAIATALSDVDDLIVSLEGLIAKKQAIKQGAMQQLLIPSHKGGKRLPGFSGEWEKIKIEKVISVARGGSPRPIQDYISTNFNGVNWIKIGDTSSKSKYITSSVEKIIQEGEQYSRKVKSGDFLLSNSMSFGRPYILKIDGCIHDGWLVLQNYHDSFDTEFLYYTLMSENVHNQYLQKASGSGVLNLNKEIVKTVELLRPLDIEEQKAIAKILSDMDAELEQLETKKAKYQQLKQGMLQELLTGNTRLV
ncbi:restriction endonuclease subunit S [Tenacibaculum maritimum]|uniref:restriction endonuclease subunit S n=1 Tax=Tenacibaculum maritimum TaxID=107401 RepID=UPI0012E577FD|nr:restriction endonuclease subunit S [Tenacibaculum maritimum]CAA0223081.1 Type I restriction-modification enzyme S subunit, HsdS family [Tenacibaculum maritimum]